MFEKYLERTAYSGDVESLVAEIGNAIDLGGAVQSIETLTVGFEDCNIKVETTEGVLVVKVFNKFRETAEIDRYLNVIEAAIAGGVNHPLLHKTKTGHALIQSSGISAIVMDFINGQTYFDTKTTPSNEELALIASEAVKIHSLDIRPPYIFDTWAIPNIRKMYDLVKGYLDEDGKRLSDMAIKRYDSIDPSQLTKCFVHGDIMATNTLLDKNGKIWILDFAVSNIYPKIQELAVMSSSLLASGDSFTPLDDRVQRVMRAYLTAGGTLSTYDQNSLLNYAIAGATMEFLGGHKAKFIDKEDPEESDHWINIGKTTLTQVLSGHN